jgi:hypothetical protein
MFELRPFTAQAREQDLRSAAERGARLAQALRDKKAAEPQVPITIREARPGDGGALRRLAELDSSEVPPSPVLLAEAGGKLRAAVSLRDGSAVADPLYPASGMVRLLGVRARQVGREQPKRRLRWPRLSPSR